MIFLSAADLAVNFKLSDNVGVYLLGDKILRLG